MAEKIEVLPWNYFSNRKESAKEIVSLSKKVKIRKVVSISLAVIAGVTFALHGDLSVFAAHDAVPAMAQAASTADFAEQLRKATKPIRDIIFAFGHEIYFVMMAWGGIEALIGKTQQGFSRMKASTAAYVVLYWVPWIVGTVNAAVPH